MDEPIAWLRQAIADRKAAERFAADNDGASRCHAIAKWQQTSEKAIKAIIAALNNARVIHTQIGYFHGVERFISLLIRLPHAVDNRATQQHLHGFLNQETRSGIKELDALVPKRPPPGENPRRNTEYPFIDANAQWTYPAADGTFSQAEMERFRALAHRILDNASRIVSAIRRRPK
jgi:hypothetical protein